MTDYPFRVSHDPDPDRTRHRVLAVLEAANGPLRRRAVQQLTFGTDLVGAGQTTQALRSLEDRQLAARFGRERRKWVITDAGRAALALDDVMRDAG